jgi:hypothetical protein
VLFLVLTLWLPSASAEPGGCDQAVQDAEQRLLNATRNPDAWLALAESHRCSEHFHSALAAYERAASLGAAREHVEERVSSLSRARNQVVFEPPEPQPCIGRDGVETVVASVQPGLQACLDVAEPLTEGEIRVAFSVAETGGVVDLSVTSEAVSAETILACIETELRALRFPAEAGKDAVPVAFSVQVSAAEQVSPAEGSTGPVGNPAATLP